jgi:hypothetical protein
MLFGRTTCQCNRSEYLPEEQRGDGMTPEALAAMRVAKEGVRHG